MKKKEKTMFIDKQEAIAWIDFVLIKKQTNDMTHIIMLQLKKGVADLTKPI